MARRERVTDTVAGMVKMAKAAKKPLPKIPSHIKLLDGAMPFFEDIVSQRSPDEWTNVHLSLACQLANNMFSIEESTHQLNDEGSVVRNDRGTQIPNPLFNVLQQLKGSQLAILRALSLQKSAGADHRDVEKRDRAFKAAKDVQNEHEDDLLA